MKAVIFTHVLYLVLMKTFPVKGVTKCESKVELRAVLLSCPARDSGCDDDDPLSQVMRSEETQILQADSRNFERLRQEKERGFPSAVKDCKRKLVITLKVKNVGKIPCEDEYIVVDHVFDPVTGGRGRLLSPVVVKLRQEQMVQLYGLHFQRVVNGDPFEEQKAGDKVCSVDPENPTCGIAMYDGKPIPFSEGFCCSCDPHVNAKRQLSPVPRGDSLLYRDSKLISQGNSRFLREGKPDAIVDPQLVGLKSGSSSSNKCEDKESDCAGLRDPLRCDKVPNFLLEHDRKIVCDRGHFMKELCRLRDEKRRKEGGQSGGRPGTTVSPTGGASASSAVETDVVSTPPNFMEELMNSERSTSSAPPPDGGGQTTGGRGKRENRTEDKKLTLEDKLERFARSKKHLKNRRKRLLELSHGRFRKAGDRCKSGPESQRITVKGCAPGEYMREAPPRYFFSHDRAIIDPLESVDVLVNSTCKSLKEEGCEDQSKDKTYGSAGKGGGFRSFKDRKEKLTDRGFYHRRPGSEDRMGRKEKFLLGKINGRKDKVSHAEGGRMENGPGKEMKMKTQGEQETSKEAASSEGDARFSPHKSGGRKGEQNEKAVGKKENEETTRIKGDRDREARFGPKSFKGFLRKGDHDKKQMKPRIRNFFMAKNREKQKFRSELVKGHKMDELRQKEGLGEEKRREHLRKNGDAVEGDERNGKETENEDKSLEVSEGEENPSAMHLSTERTDFDLSQFFLNEKSPLSGKEKYQGERKHAKGSLQEKPQETRSHVRKDAEGNINFNLEIIRSQAPGSTRHRHHPAFLEQHAKSRMDASPLGLKTSAYGLNGKTHYLKPNQNQVLRYSPTQNYYVLPDKKFHAREPFRAQGDSGHFAEAKSRSHADAAAFGSARLKNSAQAHRNARFRKKPDRRYYVATDDYAGGEPSPPRQSLSPSAGDESPASLDTRSRENCLSEPSREPREDDVAIAALPESVREVLLSRPGEVRRKRSTLDAFRPALRFSGSEVDSREPDERVVDEVEICPAEEMPRKSGAGGCAGPRFAGAELANLSTDANAFSSSREPRTGIDRPTPRGTTKREKNGKSDSDEQRLIRSYLNAPDYVLEEAESALEGKREAAENKAENSRGGPSCDKYVYGGEFPQDTAHCMRFGDLWYGLYAIEKPVVSQIVGVQLFDKHSLCDGTAQWRDLTKGKMIRVGTFFSKAEDELPTVSLSFMGENTKKVESSIDPDDYFLLIPSHVSDPTKVNSYPQFEGGPAEYMLVRPRDVTSGGECNAIGTSFEAFARQPDRCSRQRGSCLKRQPVDLWREDMEARIKGRKGKYFVENFGNVPNSPVKTYTNLTGEFLALEYYGDYSTTIEIEVKADSNAIIRKGSNAQIPLVYVDSTHPKKTRIILSVLNVGLTSSYFRPRLGDCPPDLDPAWCPLEGPLVTIPPQQRHDFKLDLSGAVPASQIFLTVQVLNQVNKQIALRKITIKRGERCVCAFHCKCNCVGSGMAGRSCRRLSLEEYRKAGYAGSYPFRGGAAASAPESIFGNIHIVLLTASYLLLLLGVMKGVVGIFVRRIGIAGTRIITGPRELYGYYEYELQGCSVLYDECGFPVHPTTCQPVQIVPLWLETVLNFFFFFLYPARGIWFLLLSSPCCRMLSSDFEGFGLRDEGECDPKCSRPLLSKRTDPTCVHYNLTTVDSVKSQQEYLPYSAYKGDDDPLEEDDTEFVLREMKRYRKN